MLRLDEIVTLLQENHITTTQKRDILIKKVINVTNTVISKSSASNVFALFV
jgi:hypothetical protein